MVMMEDWFGKLPEIPKGGREAIVAITPWLALIFGILGVIASLAGFGILTVFSPAMIFFGGRFAGIALLNALLSLIASILLLMAFPGTKKRKTNGWMMLFYSEVVNVIGAIIALSLSGVLVSLIAFYLLFQIKSYYK